MSAENTIRLDSGSSVSVNGSVTMNNSPTNPVYTAPGSATGTNFYFIALVDTAGVVAANNFLSIFNPLGSGKILIAYQATIQPWATGATAADASMNVFRTTTASAGTLVAASAVNRLVTAAPNPIADVRTGNPTATTTGASLIGFAPAIATAASGVSSSSGSVGVPGASFVMAPGEGIVFRTTLGDVDQRWNMQFIWAEQ